MMNMYKNLDDTININKNDIIITLPTYKKLPRFNNILNQCIGFNE